MSREEELELENELLRRKIEREHEIREMEQDYLYAENAKLKDKIAELEKYIKQNIKSE